MITDTNYKLQVKMKKKLQSTTHMHTSKPRLMLTANCFKALRFREDVFTLLRIHSLEKNNNKPKNGRRREQKTYTMHTYYTPKRKKR